MRLNNPDSEDTHQETRVQNEVAILILARDAPTLQDYQLPESIHNFGGASFDRNSAILSGPMKTAGAGTWDSLEKSCRECLKAALAKTDKNLYIRTGKKTVFESVLMPSLRMDCQHCSPIYLSSKKSLLYTEI
ncbi:hypothetical protein ACHAPG_004652 [Botrytis cinerea]